MLAAPGSPDQREHLNQRYKMIERNRVRLIRLPDKLDHGRFSWTLMHDIEPSLAPNPEKSSLSIESPAVSRDEHRESRIPLGSLAKQSQKIQPMDRRVKSREKNIGKKMGKN